MNLYCESYEAWATLVKGLNSLSVMAELLPGKAWQGVSHPRAVYFHEGMEDHLPIYR